MDDINYLDWEVKKERRQSVIEIRVLTLLKRPGWRKGRARVLQAADLPIIFLADKCWCLFKAATWIKREKWKDRRKKRRRRRRNSGEIAKGWVAWLTGLDLAEWLAVTHNVSPVPRGLHMHTYKHTLHHVSIWKQTTMCTHVYKHVLTHAQSVYILMHALLSTLNCINVDLTCIHTLFVIYKF